MHQPDTLLATKLHMPRVRPGLAARHRLTSELSAGLDHDLTLVVAPAGYGKSIALTQWAASIAPTVSWLSLDAQDNDPVRFWRHVLAALDSAYPGIAAQVGPLAGPPPPSTFDGFVTALINDVVTDARVPSSSRSTSTPSSIFAVSRPPSRAGYRRCPMKWSGAVHGCCSPRPRWRA